VSEKLDRFQAEIDSVPVDEADRYENLLRRMRYSLHDNHYLITDTKRRLIGQQLHHKDLQLLVYLGKDYICILRTAKRCSHCILG
jgi:hypothetical protein